MHDSVGPANAKILCISSRLKDDGAKSDVQAGPLKRVGLVERPSNWLPMLTEEVAWARPSQKHESRSQTYVLAATRSIRGDTPNFRENSRLNWFGLSYPTS